MFRIVNLRNESISQNLEIKKRLEHYLNVQKGKKLAHYLIAKKTPTNVENLNNLNIQELWDLHKKTRRIFDHLNQQIQDGRLSFSEVLTPQISFLDLKVHLANIILNQCHFCERRCGIDRTKDQRGFCRLSTESVITSAFLHIGEEPPLIPSGTIFFTGCTFKCIFCQNWTISQEWGSIDKLKEGRIIDPQSIAQIMVDLSKNGAKNINWVGGEPTPNIHNILKSLTYFKENIIQLWNSNMYLSPEGLDLILDVIDFWLPDLKFYENQFAYEMTQAQNYWEIITRNIKQAYDFGTKEMIIRHLVMPERVEKDTLPILDWCSQQTEQAFVNIMGQWRPEHKISGNNAYQNLNRRLKGEELVRARNYADKLGILWREVS